MLFYTMDRNFVKQEEIGTFISGIWTDRYYGNSEVELIVPATLDMIQKLPEGTFLGEVGSDEPMIIETADIDDEKGILKLTGITLLEWMNNRFIRASAAPEDKYWSPGVNTVGWYLWAILYYWCVGGPYLNGSIPTGIPNPSRFMIRNINVRGYDQANTSVNIAVPYGPVYDAMRDIATTYQIGMKITLGDGDRLYFLAYKGADRTSRQDVNNIVRFSEDMGTLSKIKELRSIKNLKTIVYSFCPSNPDDLFTSAGSADLSTGARGFDLRALMTFEEDITTDQVGGSSAVLVDILNQRAAKALDEHRYVKTVDGEIVPDFQFKYETDYNLGDLIEVEGRSGVVQISRVTEYIRAHDAAGEKGYPTVAMLE
jgi:Siphovirus ReqiPepy6 Gp37-like protein